MSEKNNKLEANGKFTRSSTSFSMTLNQPERFGELKKYLTSLKGFTYGIAGKEKAPTTGHVHLQIFVQFWGSKRLAISKLEGAHVEKCYASAKKNRRYAAKGGDIIWEEGKLREKGGFPSIREIKELTPDEREELSAQLFNTVNKINLDECSCFSTDNIYKKPRVYYISGRSGIGKTRLAHFLIGNNKFDSVKYENGFWIGVSGRVTYCLYDDWRDSHMSPSEFIHFIDYNRQLMNVKGSFRMNNYLVIIITSVQRLKDIYQDASSEDRAQWTRRIKEIYLSEVSIDDTAKWLRFMIIAIKNYYKKLIFKIILNKNIKLNEH